MKCPHCKKTINIGSILRAVPSEKRSEQSRINGRKGSIAAKLGAIAEAHIVNSGEEVAK